MTTTSPAVRFDVSQARQALSRATVTENKPGALDFAKFELINGNNQTRTVVAVNHHGGEVHVRIDVWPADFTDFENTEEFIRCRVCGGDFHYIENVSYHGADTAITFQLPSKSGVPTFLIISNDGWWTFEVA